MDGCLNPSEIGLRIGEPLVFSAATPFAKEGIDFQSLAIRRSYHRLELVVSLCGGKLSGAIVWPNNFAPNLWKPLAKGLQADAARRAPDGMVVGDQRMFRYCADACMVAISR